MEKIRTLLVRSVKKVFGIENLSLWVRKRRQNLERLFYHKKYSAEDILAVMISQGLKPGDTIVVHCAMNNFYNYRGSANDLIDVLIDYLGEEGTLCMPSYPFEKDNPNIPFDLANDKTAAGFLAETFRHYPGVRRSMNKLHSVCALGKNADYLTCEHQYSRTCFDKKSPYYKIASLGGKSFALGMPRYYIGTIEHVSESLLYDDLIFFKEKFTTQVQFKYINYKGFEEQHSIYTRSKQPYVRRCNSSLEDRYFDHRYFSRKRLSNIWISMFDANYTVKRLIELSREGKTLYKSPKFIINN